MCFFVLYFSRSSLQVAKIYVVQWWSAYRLHYDIAALILANGSMLVCMYFGYDMFYSDKNDCDMYDSTALLNSIMFVILFVGYFICFMWIMIAMTIPCLYCMVRDQAENSRR